MIYLFDLFDPHAELRTLATHRNWILAGARDCWQVLDGMGNRLAIASNPVDAMSEAIFGA